MIIYYRTKKLGKQCNKEREMIKAFSKQRVKKIKARLNELRTAQNLSVISSLPPARCHPYKGKVDGKFTVDLDQPYRFLFIVANEPIPRKKDGGIDITKVTEVEILDIIDPH